MGYKMMKQSYENKWFELPVSGIHEDLRINLILLKPMKYQVSFRAKIGT